jgi:hypothetical protein
MKRRCHLRVIVQRGRVVGTQQVVDPPSRVRQQFSAQLCAGPGQRLVELTVDLPDRLDSARAIERFHTSLLPLLRKRKTPPRRTPGR